jgi:hypothetical protein
MYREDREDIEGFKIKSAINRALRSEEDKTYLWGYLVEDSPYLEHNTILLTDREFNSNYSTFSRSITIRNVMDTLEEIISYYAKPDQILLVPMGVEKLLSASSQGWAKLMRD